MGGFAAGAETVFEEKRVRKSEKIRGILISLISTFLQSPAGLLGQVKCTHHH
jgi:hypothetical protein